MAYEPINWQTGDTITAEKLNKMDNGWSVTTERTTLFDGSVTTAESSGVVSAQIEVYETVDTAPDSLTVTFEGTEYTCPKIDGGSNFYGYGGFSQTGLDFTEFPFCITFDSGDWSIYTETAGTYTLKIESVMEITETSEDFQNAVNSCIGTSDVKILECVEHVTTIKEAQNMLDNGGIVYFTAAEDTIEGAPKKLFFINNVSVTCTIFPTSTVITAGFGRDSGLFYITRS